MHSHGTRAEAPTHGIANVAPVAAAGILLTEELDALDKAAGQTRRARWSPSSAAPRCPQTDRAGSAVGKVRNWWSVAVSQTPSLKATGHNVGKSLCEDDLVPTAQALIEENDRAHTIIPIAVDVVCGKPVDATKPAVLKDANDVPTTT